MVLDSERRDASSAGEKVEDQSGPGFGFGFGFDGLNLEELAVVEGEVEEASWNVCGGEEGREDKECVVSSLSEDMLAVVCPGILEVSSRRRTQDRTRGVVASSCKLRGSSHQLDGLRE